MRRQVVVEEELAEASVHPNGVYAQLVRAFEESAAELFSHESEFITSDCPVCSSSKNRSAFKKLGFSYRECGSCGSLFTSPRPSSEQMDSYLAESVAARFRSSDSYIEAMQPRARELACHRADWVGSLCDRFAPPAGPIVVYEPGGTELMDSLVEVGLDPVIAVRPLFAARRAASSATKWKIADNLESAEVADARLVAALDVLEHQPVPAELIQRARAALAPMGCLAVTTRCGGGFDIQLAWESATIFPVEHMNLPTVEGMESLLSRIGFDVHEMSTPGQLDVQLIERLASEGRVELPRVLRYFFARRDAQAKQGLQHFLQQNLLSSHLRVVARKRDEGSNS